MEAPLTVGMFKSAGDFINNTNCPLAIAVKKVFPDQFIHARTTHVRVNEDTWWLDVEYTGHDHTRDTKTVAVGNLPDDYVLRTFILNKLD